MLVRVFPLIVLLGSGLLVGCVRGLYSPAGDPASESPTFTPSPESPPSPTPTLTPTPTPTPMPAERLAAGWYALEIGEYALAAEQFRSLAQEEGLARKARFGWAASLSEMERLNEAVAAWQEVLVDPPEGAYAVAAWWRLARIYEALGQVDKAIEAYRRAWSLGGNAVADLLAESIGDLYAQEGQQVEAIEAYQQALAATEDADRRFDLLEKIGLAYGAMGETDLALGVYDQVIAQSQNPYRLARVHYLRGQTLALVGRTEEAFAAYRAAVETDVRPYYAYLALVELVNAGQPVDPYRRGLIDYYAGQYGAAVRAFYDYMDQVPDHAGEVHLYVARSFLQSGSYDLALRECDLLIQTHSSDDPAWGEGWLLKGEVLERQGRYKEALAVYQRLVRDAPLSTEAPEALRRAAWLCERQGWLDAAMQIYIDLAERYPGLDTAPVARFRAGLCAYRLGRRDEAIALWRASVSLATEPSQFPATRYWLARVLWEEGLDDEAREVVEPLIEAEPRGYYALRAAHLLRTGTPNNPWDLEDVSLVPAWDQGSWEEIADWVRSWACGEGAACAEDPLSGDIRLTRAEVLLLAGLEVQAQEAFTDLLEAYREDPWTLYGLARVAYTWHRYPASIRAARRLVALYPGDEADVPRALWRVIYPVPYWDLIEQEAQTFGFSPWLFLALIRQESLFDPGARSWAGALGIAQIMPDTGAWIAEQLGWPDYDESLLLRPVPALHFGAWFFAKTLEMVDGDISAALAGYNGGPGNAVRWHEASGGDPDLLVELVDVEEPQLYVKEIYRHLQIYRQLYAQDALP